ncbi:glutamyl-tRNA reductase [Gammaproteobacteria bacterium]|jgi:glutamyl-tRNA reductase|nr:glutamyl-tRNA reductase [Gammaproteobacteria bacterium]MDA9143028.1 glutamyl-tRNA reductase [Gammaproteobacteria bacterium]MDC0367399.1 glutamyl-tRNA reductase [Gammaproteobacteria bacterium]MDC3248537.1 glutamyl-tRNA reductase [Gammaproteobacteria bacterium]
MELQLFGINHKTSNVSDRERFIINESNQFLLNTLIKDKYKNIIFSFFGLSTCNRSEIYILGKKGVIKSFFEEASKLFYLNEINISQFYFLQDEDAFIHMCKVAAGIDSQVLGEQEIFGQYKNAIALSKSIGVMDSNLQRYANKAIEVVRKVRTNTNIGVNPLSISGLSLKLIKNIFENPIDQKILVIGAGSLAQDVIKNLYNKGVRDIRAVNRSVKEIIISDSFGIVSSPLSTLHSELEQADVVIASAITELPIIGKGAVEKSLFKRGNKPLLLIDLAVPRNIEEEVKDIETIYLYTIDDIEKITQDNLGQRRIEAEKALNMIVRESQNALLELRNIHFKSSLNRDIYNLLNSLDDDELSRFKKEINHKDLIMNLLSNNSFYDDSFETLKEINKVDKHIVSSMVKGYFDA